MKISVIGGGPAGMTAVAFASREGAEVLLFEKNEKLGKKLLITGKGRCNFTNDSPIENHMKNVASNPRFLFSAYNFFGPADLIAFFENLGVKTKTERGGRVFPNSDKSADVLSALKKELTRREPPPAIFLNKRVSRIDFSGKTVFTENNSYKSDAIIIATGGMSYPATGSVGDGYAFAKAAGHAIVPPRPSLVPLISDCEFIKDLEGLSLKNVAIKYGGRSDFGEALFTKNGVSGPLILTASRYISKGDIFIDFKPALSEKQLDERILRDFNKNINKDFANSLDLLFPKKMIPVIIKSSKIDPRKKVNLITKAERKKIIELTKNFKISATRTAGFNEAVVTAGGVSLSEINPKTMESKLAKGVYFAGEVMDLDAFTGGYNLQIAFSTGALAGYSAARGS
jgi:predicted Rossmann fold flavoprotein